jgi:regulator of replication initiation timing
MDQQQILQISLAVISLVSVLGSGYLSYKTHKDKVAQKLEDNKLAHDQNLIESEMKFRADLLAMIADLKERIKSLEESNEELRRELQKAERKIEDLENTIEEQFDTIAILGSFCKYIPAPVWVKKVHEDNTTTMYFINRFYEEQWGISAEFYAGKTDDEVWGTEIADHFRKADSYILKYKRGSSFIENIPTDPFNLDKGYRKCVIWKFPILNGQKLIGIGGILIDIDSYVLRKTSDE